MKKKKAFLILILVHWFLATPLGAETRETTAYGCPTLVIPDWNTTLSLAENGNATAQFQIGDAFFHGIGQKQDFSAARKWFEKASEKENALALYHLGLIYYRALGVATDTQETEKLYQRAAATGGPAFQCLLGRLYEQKNMFPEAHAWYKKATENKDPLAMYYLGVNYLRGYGVVPDFSEALKLIQKSADAGYFEACYFIGTCYDKGEGFNQDLKEAFRWYSMAARKGDIRAWGALGSMYEKGDGVEKNPAEADAWYSLLAAPEIASSSGGQYLAEEAIRRRTFLEKDLTPTEKKAAEATLDVLKRDLKPVFSESFLIRGQQ